MATRGGGSQSYGFPIYCAAWLPLAHILKPDPPAAEADADADAASSSPPPPMAVLGGGGGEGRSGVPNKLVVAALAAGEEAAPALSPETVIEVKTQEEVPYRMAVHPRGDGVFCAFPNGCRLYRWESHEGEGPQKLALEPDEEALAELKDVGLQLSVSFSGEGSILAIGGELNLSLKAKIHLSVEEDRRERRSAATGAEPPPSGSWSGAEVEVARSNGGGVELRRHLDRPRRARRPLEAVTEEEEAEADEDAVAEQSFEH